MNVLDTVFDFLTYIFNGLYNVFLSTRPFNVMFVIGLVFLLITVLLSLIESYGLSGGRGGIRISFHRGAGINGPSIVRGSGFRRRSSKRVLKNKKKIGIQNNYITNVYSDGEKIESKVISND